MITKEQLRAEVNQFLIEKPREWRKGQAVFNFIDAKYNVARDVQLLHGIDCFYSDDRIDDFLEKSLELINEQNIN